jgi:thermostable 8-oxoguanine DNA glycosylase
MDEVTPLLVTNHYRRNKDQYNSIEARLKQMRAQFHKADPSEQIRMLQKSHSFAVISVQTSVDIHEDAFTKLWANGTPSKDLESALESVNYRNKKANHIRHSLRNGHKWAKVAQMLDEDSVDEAHKFILDEMKGVGPAKAPFTLAMLGFTEKACIDANIVSAMGLDEHVSTVVVEKYDNIVETLRDKMPTLKQETSPFMWQWVTFSWNRGEISTHDTFYEVLGVMK